VLKLVGLATVVVLVVVVYRVLGEVIGAKVEQAGAVHRELQGAAHLAQRGDGQGPRRLQLLPAALHQFAHPAGLRRPDLFPNRRRQGLLRAAGHAEAGLPGGKAVKAQFRTFVTNSW
jgi:hypothetical protein